jgi:ribosomal protein S18 acetylase RimI-like enzyme
LTVSGAGEVAEPEIDPAHDDPQLPAWLEDRLYEFNVAATGHDDGAALAFTVRDGERVVAGIAGHTWGGCCEIKQLWVDASHRGRGYGRALLERVEAEARARGCARITLSSHTFQAPAMYRRLGFVEVGRVDGFPRGHGNVVFLKSL